MAAILFRGRCVEPYAGTVVGYQKGWKQNIVNLTTVSWLLALQVAIMTTNSDDKLVKQTILWFQWRQVRIWTRIIRVRIQVKTFETSTWNNPKLTKNPPSRIIGINLNSWVTLYQFYPLFDIYRLTALFYPLNYLGVIKLAGFYPTTLWYPYDASLKLIKVQHTINPHIGTKALTCPPPWYQYHNCHGWMGVTCG